ncbi:MAG TPA: hypothetical protein VI981_01505 [Candidatus Paceibacterota bacterium]
MSKKLYLFIGILIVIGAFYLWPHNTSDVDNSADDEGASAHRVGSNAILVNNQMPGKNVAIALVALLEDGWVVIHKDSNGKPGQIIGTKYFKAGESRGFLELAAPSTSGTYYAALYSDNGDGRFDVTEDAAIVSDGEPMMMIFQIGPEFTDEPLPIVI